MLGWLHRLFSSPPLTAEKPETPAVLPFLEPAKPVLDRHSTAPTPTPKMPAMSWMQQDGLNANFLNWLFEGSDESDLFANQSEKDILAALDKIVNSKQSGADLVRRLPGVVPQLLQSLRTDDFSGAELARKISNDVVLVAAVIRIANSWLYKSTEAITSIEHAVLVLGQTGLRQLITSVAFKPIIDLKSGHFTKMIAPKIWDQSEKCAIANRMLAEGQAVSAFDAFLAGLIQNVGLIVSLRILDQLSDAKQRIGSAAFCNALAMVGRKLSVGIGREWNFPDSVIQAIEEQGSNFSSANLSPIGAILVTGDYVSKLHILSNHHHWNENDPSLIKGLSDKAVNCLSELNQLTMRSPRTPSL